MGIPQWKDTNMASRSIFEDIRESMAGNDIRRNITDFTSGKRNLPNEVNQLSRDKMFGPQKGWSKPLRDFLLNRTRQGAYLLQGTRDTVSGARTGNRGELLGGVGQVAGGVYGLTGPGTVQNLAQSSIFGGIRGLRRGEPVLPSMSQGMAEDSLASDALGITDPRWQQVTNIGAGLAMGEGAKVLRNPKKFIQITGQAGRGYMGRYARQPLLGRIPTPRPKIYPQPKIKMDKPIQKDLLDLIRRMGGRR